MDRMAKGSSLGKSIRKRLSDITNYQPQHKSPPLFDQSFRLNDDFSTSAKQQICHLLKENEGLLKIITDKNKIIEMNGVELQKLRIVAQKTQLQNWNLAQSNSHMMAELNISKKKLKELQHQLICKDALLKTMHFDLQAKREANDHKCESCYNSKAKRETDAASIDRQNTNINRRIRPVRSQSIGHMSTVKVSEEEILQNKRRRVRRHSTKFTSHQDEANEDLFEIKDLNLHEHYSPTSRITTEQKHGKYKPKLEPQRMSFGRPCRKAAEKINSYKETPLNIKMRRPE